MRNNRISHGLLLFAAASLVSSGIGFAQMQQQPPGGGSNGSMQQPRPEATHPEQSAPTNDTAGTEDMGGASQGLMDKQFVQNALQGGMAEVALGKLAIEKSSNEDVKKFAQRMVEDHTKLGEEMKPVAAQIGVKMPEGLSKSDQALQEKLEALSGDDFDKAYLQAMLKDHKKDYADFQREAQSASIPQVKEAAQKGVPVIKSHLEHVQRMTKSTMALGGMASQ